MGAGRYHIAFLILPSPGSRRDFSNIGTDKARSFRGLGMMKLSDFMLVALLGNALAERSHHPYHAADKRFSVLERRARYYEQSTAVHRRDDFTCGPGSQSFQLCRSSAFPMLALS